MSITLSDSLRGLRHIIVATCGMRLSSLLVNMDSACSGKAGLVRSLGDRWQNLAAWGVDDSVVSRGNIQIRRHI